MTYRHRRHRLTSLALGTALVVAVALAPSCMREPVPGTEHVIHATQPDGGPPLARVLVAERRPSVAIAVGAPCTVHDARTEEPLLELSVLPHADVRVQAGNQIALGGRRFAQEAIRIVCHRDGFLSVDGHQYRGNLLLRRHADGTLNAVNILPVDAYLYSVLGSETYASWPAAAHDAQAVVARSYALWRIAQRRNQPYDLRATVLDQNYLGLSKENPKLKAAVDRTAGLALLYQMKLFRCYYHSTCGGHTEAVERVFPTPPLGPLSGARCTYCRDSKHYRWEREMSKSALATALRDHGVNLQGIEEIVVTERSPTGRGQTVVVTAADGRELTFPAADFRLKIGARELPSTWFQLHERGSEYLIQGRGWGHGVGLCQWGSRGMAEAGHSAREILRHYYPGATLQKVYSKHKLFSSSVPSVAPASSGASASGRPSEDPRPEHEKAM